MLLSVLPNLIAATTLSIQEHAQISVCLLFVCVCVCVCVCMCFIGPKTIQSSIFGWSRHINSSWRRVIPDDAFNGGLSDLVCLFPYESPVFPLPLSSTSRKKSVNEMILMHRQKATSAEGNISIGSVHMLYKMLAPLYPEVQAAGINWHWFLVVPLFSSRKT